ncbi:TerD family protein [Streptomyces sp. NPDC051561]|uniref:TerD family protein n=1 Tax=Streptomyces sp. NPDC051561 TaxID=3365658 RepID=UPI00379497D5
MTHATPAASSSLIPDVPEYAHDWALVDVETSGLVARRDRVLSVAVITVGPDGRQTGEFSTLIDPGPDCDPGPVEVHGLTRERLRGAPSFAEVAGRIGAMLQDRVLVAHNAQFDYDFLAHEFARSRLWLPVAQRLCTLALNRRVDPPTADLKLGTLAAHYGVVQRAAHDALDDTRVLAGILRATLHEAGRLDLPLPLVACPPRQDVRFAPKPPKTPCAYRNPGRFVPAVESPFVEPLVAPTVLTDGQDEGVREAPGAPGRPDASVTPVVPETPATPPVLAGVPVPRTPVEDAPAPTAAPGPTATPAAPARRSRPRATGPLAGRRVLVLGGTHPEASAARARAVELGAAAAVNLSASVTDVVLLPGSDKDRRMRRITELVLPTHPAHWLDAPVLDTAATPADVREGPQVLPRGGVVDLNDRAVNGGWQVTAAWGQLSTCEIDLVALLVDEEDQVSSDENFVFFSAPESPDGTVRLLTDGPTEQSVVVDTAALPTAVRKVVIAAAIDGAATFGEVGAIQFTVGPGDGTAPLAQAALDAATTERTMLVAEIYRRGPVWRCRAVGQGYDHGLAELARNHGVDVADD